MDGAAPEALPARFSDRLLAFFADAGLFSSGYFLSAFLIAILRGGAPSDMRFYAVWVGLWLTLFVLYHARFASDGRRTLGKRLFGLRVVSVDGEPVEFSAALARACVYLPGSLFFFAGFLPALRKDGRALHDHAAGTRVIEVAAKTPRRRALNRAGAGLFLAACAATFLALFVVGPGMMRGRVIIRARAALKSVAYLEETRKARGGIYTADLADLLGSSDEARQIAAALPYSVHLESLKVTLTAGGYDVEAEALDERRTAMVLHGPVQLR